MATSHSKEGLQQAPRQGSQPAASGMLALDDHRLYWERYGNRSHPCLLLLHHGLGSIRSWRRQIPAFLEAGWQVLVYDRWGYGRSDVRSIFQHAYLAQDAEEAIALLDEQGVEKVTLVGHSDGGSIALLMAAQHPERVQALVVVAAHIYFEPKMVTGLAGIAQAAIDSALIGGLEREHGQRARGLLHAWVEHWQAPESQSLDMRGMLPAISSRTLVIQGELDEHATARHAIDIAEGVQQGDVWLIPDVGHMPPHEIPETFNQRVLEFLAT